MSMPKYLFVWWGDGEFVYEDGRYIGKDDQLDLVDLMVQAGVAQRKYLRPDDDPISAPDTTDELPPLLDEEPPEEVGG